MASTAVTFPYAPNDIDALELTLSKERLQPYVIRAGGSRPRAILIYERNTALSEALYGVTQAAEVAIRNSIHRVLSNARGPMWFDHTGLGLETIQADKVSKAKHEITINNRALTPGAIVAELHLGFWTSLIAARYEKSLWVPHLHKAFPHALRDNRDGAGRVISRSPVSRADIYEQLERIKILRNRIAHHEPILKFDLPKLYSETLTALSWVCPTSAQWVRCTNCFPKRFHEKPLSYAPPKMADPAPTPVPGMPLRPRS